MRRGRGSDVGPVEIDCEFRGINRTGTVVSIWDGSMAPIPHRPTEKWERLVWIPVHMIEDGFDVDKRTYVRGDRLKISIPEWLANKEGLI